MRKVIYAELVPDDELLRLINDWSSCLDFAYGYFARDKSYGLREVRQLAKQEYKQLTAGWVSSAVFCAKYSYSKVGAVGKLKLWAIGGRCKQGNGLARLVSNNGSCLLRITLGKRNFVMYDMRDIIGLGEEIGWLLQSGRPYNVLLLINDETQRCKITVSYSSGKPNQRWADIDEKLLVKCQICDAKLKRISSLHLRQHAVTLGEYFNLFPNAEISSQIWRNTLKRTATGRQFSEEVREKLSTILRKNWADPAYRDRQLKLWMSALTVHPNKPEKLMQQLLDKLQPNQ